MVSPATLTAFRTEHVAQPDALLGVPARWALGRQLSGSLGFTHPHDRAVCTCGNGGQLVWADPETGLVVAYLQTRLALGWSAATSLIANATG